MSGAHCLATPGRGEGIQAEVRQHYSGWLAEVGKTCLLSAYLP